MMKVSVVRLEQKYLFVILMKMPLIELIQLMIILKLWFVILGKLN